MYVVLIRIVIENIEHIVHAFLHPNMMTISFRFTLGVILLLMILTRLSLGLSNEIRSSHWFSSHFSEKPIATALRAPDTDPCADYSVVDFK
jgi:hypothetical protein